MSEHKVFSHLLHENAYNLDTKNGQMITGVVVTVSKDMVYIDVGTKKNIKFKRSEIYGTMFNPIRDIVVGEKISFYLESHDKYENNLVLNYDKGQKLLREETIWKEIQDKKYINGRILNYVNGGYSVGIGGLVAFLPKNHLGDIKEKVMGQLKTFSLLKVNRSTNNVIVSRLSAVEAWKRKRIKTRKKEIF